MEMQRIKGIQIKNLITKFFYKENHLCFQILIHFGSDETVSYREFSDYATYKNEYNKLLSAKAENTLISIPGNKSKTTNLNFA